jgi:sporulation protein YqfC
MSIRKRIADALELQHDVALNLPVLHITGFERLLMENHRGLLEYGRNKIRIASTAGTVEIAGEGLAIKSVGRDEVLITGSITNVLINHSAVKT